MTILQLLDDADTVYDQAWYSALERSLGQRSEWASAVVDAGTISDERAWTLLGWIEEAATELVRHRSRTTLVTAAFAMSLLSLSLLDRRDIIVVAMLLRRGATLADLNFIDAVTEGCDQAGELGQAAFILLTQAPSITPQTHLEIGQGDSFAFQPRPPDFDVAALERWLQGDGE